jgi:hypothetical protein
VQRHRPKQPAIREDRSRAASGVGKGHNSREASNDRGAKGPEFKGNAGRSQSAEIDRSLTTPPSVRELQVALYVKAKAKPAYRLYALYDKSCRQDVLMWAWGCCCRANGGSAGVDGESFAKIEARGSKDGWKNWRRNYEPRPIARKRCGGSIYRKGMAKPGRSEYRLSKIEWRRWQRSLRRI